MITPNTVVVGVSPTISPATFERVLVAANSPAAAESNGAFGVIQALGVDPAFCLAAFKVESQFATDPKSIVVKYGTRNPGNCRSSTIGTMPLINTERGIYVKYPDWISGWQDMANRLVAKWYVYAQEGRKTINQIIYKWAPPTDSNDPATYVRTVVSLMNQWIGEDSNNTTMQDPTNKIDIVHPNKGRNGGTPQIIVLHVQDGLNYLPDFFRSSGDDSTMWCKQDGTLVRMEQDTDSAWTNGYMTEPIDHTNPIIQNLYNQGVRNSNNYSLTIEHQGFSTGVFTDAAIESTAKMCAYWMLKYGWTDVNTRIVGHYQIGEHKNCPGPNFPWAKLRARVQDLIGGINKVNIEQGPKLPTGAGAGNSDTTQLNGKTLGGGFKQFYDKLAGVSPNFQLLVLGLPVTNEFDCDVNSNGKSYTVQLFERGCLLYEALNASPWDIHLATTSQLENALAAAKAKSLLN